MVLVNSNEDFPTSEPAARAPMTSVVTLSSKHANEYAANTSR